MISEDKPKIYYSFSETRSGREAGQGAWRTGDNQPYPEDGGHGIRFGAYELLQIAIAITVLTISFAIVFSRFNFGGGGFWIKMPAFLGALPVALVAVVTGFMLHELAHKFTAMHYGMWSEFRASGSGLVMTLVLALLAGIVFAAPGAVVIFGRPDKKENGIISAAGPLTNIFVSAIALAALVLAPLSGYIALIVYYMAFINAFLALFNLIPIPPLDGSKVVKWNVATYVLMLAVSGFMVYHLW